MGMRNLTPTPQLLQQMIENNPMLQQLSQRDPMLAQMMQNPQVMQQMLNPQTLQAILQMQQAMGGMGGSMVAPGAMAANPGVAPGTAPTPGVSSGGATPEAFDPALMEAAMQAMMVGGIGGGGSRGGVPPAPDTRPPEERFASQLNQLVNMGFSERPPNLQALKIANGDINQAINYLLEGGGG